MSLSDTQNGHAPDLPAAAEVLRLTDAQRARLALYLDQLRRAQAAFEDAFTNVMIGRGVDLERYEVRLTTDGAAVLLRERTPAGEGGDAHGVE